MRGRSRRRAPESAASAEPERVSLQLIAQKLERLTWRRRLWGADERQVWHVIHRMDEMYRQLYREQEVRYQALLEEARGSSVPTGQATAAAGSPAAPPMGSPRQPLQAVPASRPPQRFRGETVASPSSGGLAAATSLSPVAPVSAPPVGLGETRAIPARQARHLAPPQTGSAHRPAPQALAPQPPTPGSSPSGASWL